MRKNGFTLIELLAVIVILAIIALIATPIILNIINDARKESQERSVELYASAVKNGIAKYQLVEGKEIALGTYTTETLPFEVEYEGEVECATIELYENGGVYVSGCSVNDSVVDYTYGTQQFKMYANGDEIYYDVTTGLGCSKSLYESSYGTATVLGWSYEDSDYVDVEVTDYLNSVTGYNGVIKASDKQNGCMKFYAFNDSGGDKLNLILDHNTTDWTYWGGSNARLKNDTDEWVGTITPANYTFCRDLESEFGACYTVDYVDYKARLITANEIAQIAGNTGWDEIDISSGYYFDSLTSKPSDDCKSGSISGCQYRWLYDRTSEDCLDNGCLNNSKTPVYGYWTNTFYSSVSSWAVFSDGSLRESVIDSWGGIGGVRPVITILKSQL